MIFLCDNSFSSAVRDLTDRFNMVSKDTSQSISERIIYLKQIVDSMCFFATAGINFSRSEVSFLSQAIGQTQYVIEVLGDDSYSLAPDIIREGLLDIYGSNIENIWGDLAVHIKSELSALRLSLDGMIKREASCNGSFTSSQHIRPPQQHLRH